MNSSHAIEVFPRVHIETPTDLEIAISRSFAAPRELVFDAFTRPEIVREWLWAMDRPMTVCEIDLRAEGAIRYVWQLGDDREMGMSGRFREIVPPERLVHTEIFDEDWTGGETLVTTTFVEAGAHTNVVMRVEYSSTAARDAALGSGMDEGMDESYFKLDAWLSERSD